MIICMRPSLTILPLCFESRVASLRLQPLLLRALALREKKPDSADPAIGSILSNLGSIYEAEGRFIEAELYYNRALKRQMSVPSSNHLEEVANLQSNLAGLFVAQRRFDEAEPIYRSSSDNLRKNLGPSHPKVGDVLNNLASMRFAQERYEEAEKLYKQSLYIAEKALGANHPSVSDTLANLANLSFIRRDWAGALDYGRKGTELITSRVLQNPQSSERHSCRTSISRLLVSVFAFLT